MTAAQSRRPRLVILPLRTPVGRRLLRLFPGLVCFGLALGLSIRAGLGTNPWTVFHEGAADRLGVTVGSMVVITGAGLLLAFLPLREPMGLGTLLNVALIGPIVDITLALVPELDSLPERLAALAVSPVLIGLGSGLYIGAGLGPGPRDGIMTALSRRGISVARARTAVEVTALTVGYLLGGTVGFGTLYMALTVGFWVQRFLARLRIDPA